MTAEKAELKSLWIGSNMSDLEKRLDAYEKDTLRLEGAANAYGEAAPKIRDDVLARIKAHVEADEVSLECAEYARKITMTVVRYVEHLHAVVQKQQPILEGRKVELKALLDVMRKQRVAEDSKAIAIKQSDTGNGAGQHPGGSLKAERNGAAKKTAKKRTTKRATKKTTTRKKTTKRAPRKRASRAANT